MRARLTGSSTVAATILVIVAAAAAVSRVSDGGAIAAAAKVIVAAVAVGVVPGVLITLAWRPRPTLDALELLAIGVAVSFGLVHLLTIALIEFHGSVQILSVVLLIAEAAGGAWLWYAGRKRSMTIAITADDAIGMAALLLAAACLYGQGSPFSGWEDQIHVSIVRRLAALPRVTLDNFYLTPGVVYTYPFPSTHAFMALVSRMGGADALFVYHKLRFFWSPAALLMIYLGARAVFGRASFGIAALVIAAALMIAGLFAVVDENAYWGQLAVFSHASDVAMAVLLPSILAVTYRFLDSDLARERALMAMTAITLVFMLASAHDREIVQYLAYLGCFACVAAACARFRPYAIRAAWLLVASAALALAFLAWHNAVVGHVTDEVAAERVTLRATAAALSLHDLVLAPADKILGSMLRWFDAAFTGITQWLILAAPIAVVAFRQRPLVWLIAASTVAYLLVMNVPALAIPYIYVTYYEILNTPIRNVIPFLHLLAGALLYVIVCAVYVAIRRQVLAAIALVASGLALGLIALLAPTAANETEFRFFLPVVLAWGGTFLWLDRSGARITLGRTRWVVAAAVAVVALALLWPDHPAARAPVPVYVRWRDGLSDAARTASERRFTLTDGQNREDEGYWTYDLANTSQANIRALVQDPDVATTYHLDRTNFDIEHPSGQWYRYPTAFTLVATAFGLWGCGFVLPWAIAVAMQRNQVGVDRFATAPFYRYAGYCLLMVAPFILLTRSPHALPLASLFAAPGGVAPTPAAVLRLPPCDVRSGDGQSQNSCPASPEVVSWIQRNVPVNAVLATDYSNMFQPTVFIPQQIVAFPGLSNPEDVFPAYTRLYRARMRDQHVQPFFNTVETPGDRRAFLTSLHVTYVLVDPAYYEALVPILDALPQMLTQRYADRRWAIYEFRTGA